MFKISGKSGVVEFQYKILGDEYVKSRAVVRRYAEQFTSMVVVLL